MYGNRAREALCRVIEKSEFLAARTADTGQNARPSGDVIPFESVTLAFYLCCYQALYRWSRLLA
jgi:hypothetical protein